MNTSRFGELEVLCHAPPGIPPHDTPLLFVHGAYTGAWCWAENFLPWFAQQGWSSYALSLSGHGRSRRREYLDSYSINDYVNDVAEIVSKLPTPPVLVGHSMGGMVVQKYLERFEAPAVILMASVPPQGLMASTLGMMFTKPNLLGDLNRIMGGGNASMDSLREALFNQPVTTQKLLRYYQLCQPESHRAIWDMTLFNLPRPNTMHTPPMLVLGATHDLLISPEQVHMTAETYGCKAELFERLGHGMMLEHGWINVAEHINEWLLEQGL